MSLLATKIAPQLLGKLIIRSSGQVTPCSQPLVAPATLALTTACQATSLSPAPPPPRSPHSAFPPTTLSLAHLALARPMSTLALGKWQHLSLSFPTCKTVGWSQLTSRAPRNQVLDASSNH